MKDSMRTQWYELVGTHHESNGFDIDLTAMSLQGNALMRSIQEGAPAFGFLEGVHLPPSGLRWSRTLCLRWDSRFKAIYCTIYPNVVLDLLSGIAQTLCSHL